MNTRLLEYFLVVAEKGNITRAAAALHITQPTLSRQLIEPEWRSGHVLVHKRNRTFNRATGLFIADLKEHFGIE